MLGLFLRRVQNSNSQAFQDLAPVRMLQGRRFGTSLVTVAVVGHRRKSGADPRLFLVAA